jgi:multicomponent Na+:H+ antiporter subunit B
MSVILRQGVRYLLPILLLFSIFLLLRGHNAPGGGFVGGLVAAAAFALYAIAHGISATQRLLRVPTHALIVAGVTVAALSGLLGLLLGLPFLAGLWWEQTLPVVGKIGTPFTFDVGVYLLVIGSTLTIFFSLMETPMNPAAQVVSSGAAQAANPRTNSSSNKAGKRRAKRG